MVDGLASVGIALDCADFPKSQSCRSDADSGALVFVELQPVEVGESARVEPATNDQSPGRCFRDGRRPG